MHHIYTNLNSLYAHLPSDEPPAHLPSDEPPAPPPPQEKKPVVDPPRPDSLPPIKEPDKPVPKADSKGR